MRRKKVIIFGTGRLYNKIKKDFTTEVSIVGFVDNDQSKWGQLIDGVRVYDPQQILELDYDLIYIVSIYAIEIRKQLIDLKINMLNVYDYIDHPELLTGKSSMERYGDAPPNDCRRIVLFSHALTPTGANVILLRAATIYKEIGCSVLVISRTKGELLSQYTDIGISVWVARDILSHKQELEKIMNVADVVIINTFWFYYFLQEIDTEIKRNIIWWIHETFPFPLINRQQFDTSVRGICCVAAISGTVDKELKTAFDYEKACILLWGIPDRSKRLVVQANDKTTFAIIGAIDSKVKGQDLFVRAVECLSYEDRERAEFWIVGPGELSAEDTEIANRNDCIKKLGSMEQNRIPELYAKIDVVVCASRQEALSVVTVEAFMNEKLAIVSDAAGVVDYMVPGEDGLIFPSGDHEKLADYMHWAINHMDEARAIGQRSRRVYDKYFTMQAFKERLVQLI